MKKILLAVAVASISTQALAVSEQEALANPDDAQLNRTFAQEQFAEGNYEKALEGIERVIIAKPLDLSARFFRINLMVALNRGSEVRSELQTILGLALPESDLQRARDLLTAIDKKAAKFNGRVTAKFGFEYDDNINGWTDREQINETESRLRESDSNNFTEQLDDTAIVATIAFSGSYALTQDKSTALKFSSLFRTKNFADYVQKEQDLTSISLGVSHKVGKFTGEVGASNAKVNKVNKIVKFGETDPEEFSNPDVEVTSGYLNLNYKFSPALTLNYRYTDGKNDNDGIAAENAVLYDVETISHAATALMPLDRGLLLQLGYTYGETRNQNQADTADIDPRQWTDSDAHTVSSALFYTLPSGDSLSSRLSWTNTENLYENKFEDNDDIKLINDTDKVSLSVEYRTDLAKYFEQAEGWTLGAGVKTSFSDSNNASSEKKTNSANVFVERKWDIWK